MIDPHTHVDALGGHFPGRIDIRVDDDCAQLTERFRSRYPDPGLRVGKSLMVFDPALRHSDF